MPKVKEEYLIEKKHEILRAAFEVCKRKPAYDVTMSDIVSETGMSQGGVYKYFNNICSVYAAIIDEANLMCDRIGLINEAVDSDADPWEKLERLFAVSESFFTDMLLSYNKVLFELSAFCIQNPEYDRKIKSETSAIPVFDHLAERLGQLILTQTEAGVFHPIVPARDVISFVISSFDGIIRDVTLSRCYGIHADEMNDLNEKKLINCLYFSTLKLLGK